jgi:hypothetical protein
MSLHYPIYRKSLSGKSYYRIESTSVFLELQQLGTRWLRHEVHAKILPERVLIEDMMVCREGLYTTIQAEEFNAILESAQ